jgi:hypothetical protein
MNVSLDSNSNFSKRQKTLPIWQNSKRSFIERETASHSGSSIYFHRSIEAEAIEKGRDICYTLSYGDK